jgi:Cu2+-exporting ATPase/Cu+-exporting ATPase
VTPEQKGFLVGEADHAMMVGDGANDALALTKAHVGVAVLGSMDISLRAADVYLSNAGIRPVKDLIVLGRETMRVIRRNLVLSLIYNSLSVLAAFMGWIGPLTAAIIMPASSLTVLLSTLWGTEALRNLWKS